MAEHRRSDSVAQLAADLRRLRIAAGNPTLARLQSESGVSRTVLSDAFVGRSLPSVRTLVSIVQTCGGGPLDPWIERRDALSRCASDPPPAPRPGRREGMIVAAAVGIGAAVAMTVRGFLALLVRPRGR